MEEVIGPLGGIIVGEIGREIISRMRHYPKDVEKQHQAILSRWLSEKPGSIKIKIIAYTSQTTAPLIRQALTQAHIEKGQQIKIQLLRPSLREPLKIWNVQKDNDKIYWNEKRKDAEAFDRLLPQIVQGHPFEPLLKVIFINDLHALLGCYVLEKHIKSTSTFSVSSWDYIGYKVKMMELHALKKGANGELFSCLLDWFEKTWENFSEPIDSKEPAPSAPAPSP